MTKSEKKTPAPQDEDLNDTHKQYVISIPIGHLNRVRTIADKTDRSVQSLLREGVEMLLARHERIQKRKTDPKPASA